MAPFHRRRPVRLVAVLGAGFFAGTVSISALQAQGPVAIDAGGAQVAALAARVLALEKAKDEPLVVKGSITVVGAGGREVFFAGEESGAKLVLTGSGGSKIYMEAAGEAKIQVDKGSAFVELKAGAKGSVRAGLGADEVALSAEGANTTIRAIGSGGEAAIGFSGGNPSLRLRQGSEDILWAAPDASGAQLTLKKGPRTVKLVATGNQTGLLVNSAAGQWQAGEFENVRGFVASKGGQTLAGLGTVGNDKYRVSIYNGSYPVFVGGYDSSGSQLGLYVSDESGNDLASLSRATSGGGGELKLFNSGEKEIARLGPSEGGTGATLKVGEGEDGVLISATANEAIVRSKIGGKRTEAGIAKNATGFVVGNEGKPLAALADKGDGKAFVAVYNGSPDPVFSAGYRKNGKLSVRLGSGPNPMIAMEEAAQGVGSLVVYGKGGNKPAAELGLSTGTAMLRVYDTSGKLAALVGAPEGGRGAVKIYDGANIVAGMEATGAGSSAVYVAANQRDVVGLYNESGKGGLAVNSAGKNIVRLVTLNGGGSIVVSGSGGEDVIEARNDPSVGGLVCVNYKNKNKCLGVGLTGLEGFH